MKKIIENTTLLIAILASSFLHTAPILGVAMIATPILADSDSRDVEVAIGTAILSLSLLALGYIHGLNGSFRRPAPKKRVAWDARHEEEMSKIS